MVRTLASIFVSLALILGISAYDIYTVGKTFHTFSEALVALYEKTEDQTATHEDGKAVRAYWKEKKKDCIYGFRTRASKTSIISSTKPWGICTRKNTTTPCRK